MDLPHIKIKENQNYAAFFLTLACNLRCPYCINFHEIPDSRIYKGTPLRVDEWIKAANRLILREDNPLTLQGGEPTLCKGFYRFVNEVRGDIKMDLLTNMMFDADEFIRNAPLHRFARPAPYAAIRVSYHPGQNDIDDLINKTFKMQDAGFKIGIYGILHPDERIKKHILEVKEKCLKKGIDFRTKEFLGEYKGRLCGTYKYEGAISAEEKGICECRTTELIVDPSGYVYRCHSDLYNRRPPIAHILDENLTADFIDTFRTCDNYGTCNPCDIKVTTNRFQIFGHTSVEMKNIKMKRKKELCI